MPVANRWVRARILTCGVGLGLVGLWVGRGAYNLQIRDAEHLAEMAEDNFLRDIQIPPRRGRILDRNRRELATTVEVDSVACNPRVVMKSAGPDAVPKLAKALHLDKSEVRNKLAQRRYFAWLKRQVTPEESAAVKALGLPGISIQREPRRRYPLGTVGSTVLGHADVDGRGVEGVEKQFDQHLRGSGVTLPGIKDARGRELLIEGLDDTMEMVGRDVVLTIDSYLQLVTESALARAVDKHNAAAATAVMIDVPTGEVLALASIPNYDPNQPKTAFERGARNRAVTDAIEPGSTQKAFTFAAALDAGKVKPEHQFDCQMGRMQIGKVTIRDTHPLGILTAAETFQHSSNICTVKIARRIGREALAEALERFGIGRRTGIGLPGEAKGLLRPVERWGEIGFSNIAFGQGLTVTPVQLTAGYAMVAAGGVWRSPRVGMALVDASGRQEPTPVPPDARPEARVMSEHAARALLAIMRKVTEPEGTAKLAAIPGYPVAGKTGTAQKVSRGRYDPDKWIASFIGVVPADKPKLALSVIVDEPRPIHLGGQVAAPAFREIAEAALKYLSVPPSEPIVVAEAKEAAKPGKPERLVAEAEGPGSDAVLGEDEASLVGAGGEPLDPESAEEIEQGGEWVSVPTFSGMSLGQAVRAARTAGIEMIPEGSGVAVAQTPASARAPRGTVVRVSFRPGGG